MTEKQRILLVEDETDVQQANKQYLISQGYDVVCADTLQGARTILWELPPNLILLDVMLPDGSGLDLCREIREYSAVPIIFLSAMGEDGNVVGGLASGADDYIVKPYNMEVMGARVAAHLRRHGGSNGIIELPPLRIDLVSGNVWLNNEAIHMTPKQMKLLAYLVENRGHVLSQTRIYQDVWNASPDTMGNIVRMNISRLRKKLDLDNADSYFDIVSNHHGYRFLRIKYPTAE